jgi:hypothetical protein
LDEKLNNKSRVKIANRDYEIVRIDMPMTS